MKLMLIPLVEVRSQLFESCRVGEHSRCLKVARFHEDRNRPPANFMVVCSCPHHRPPAETPKDEGGVSPTP